MKRKFSTSSRIKSFVFAFNGIKIVFKEEHNAQIHLVATCLVIALGFYFHIAKTEWLAIIFAIALVISLEIVNTAIEYIANFICNERNEVIKKIKDLSAAAVLVAAIAALLIGAIIFIPKVLAYV